ncbi:MAG: heavy-metal-associated domain-containing protein [Clostridia bacterium]|nr:heavy-metal-associated domain-containing protein [Clostridia bacterium]
MIKTTVKIEGMSCGMCEAHVNEAIRAAVKPKKVTSDHKSGFTEIISDQPVSVDALRRILDPTGYKVITAVSAPYEKKGLFSIFR